MKSSFPIFALALPLLAACAAVAATPEASTPKATAAEGGVTEILKKGEIWSYYAPQGVPKGDWKTGAGKAGWKEGALPIGYGEHGMATIFTTDNEPSKKYPAVYLRKSFVIPKGVKGAEFKFGMLCDDGCVAYLNGKEIGRIRIKKDLSVPYPAEINDDKKAKNMAVPMSELKKGANVIAVEVYQAHPESSDMSFEARAIVE